MNTTENFAELAAEYRDALLRDLGVIGSEHALQTGTVIHLIGGTDTKADALVDEVQDATDSELLRIEGDGDTTANALPTARVPDETLVYYKDFGELPSGVQATAAQCIKGHFEFGIPVIVRSSVAARGDLTLRNGDLCGRVQAIELDDVDRSEEGRTDD